MKELIKKVLTNKAVRHGVSLSALVASVASVNAPWVD